MNSWISLIVWIFIVVLITYTMYYFGYSIWSSVAFALLLGIIILLVCFPWNFRHHKEDFSSEDDICDTGESAFMVALGLSIFYLVAYIVATVAYDKDSWMKRIICVES